MSDHNGSHVRPLLRIAALALLAGSALAAQAIPLPREKEVWLSIDAGDFQILSNAPEGETTAIATDLVRMREAISRITQLKTRSPLPTRVYIFRNETSFAPYRDALLQRKNARVGGIFLPADDSNFALLQAGADVDRVVYHELTHHFVRNTMAGLPLWFHEGIAEYYSTFAVKGGEVSLGMHIPEHVLWLRQEPLIPLAQLFAIHHGSPEYGEGRRQGVFYAQSWALVHYLMIGSDERRQQLGVFLGGLRKGQNVESAFRNAFGTGYEELERELRAYVRRPTMGYRRYPLDELKIPELPSPRTLSRDETLYSLGHLLARGPATTLGDAEIFLREALTINPKHSGAHANLGRLADLRGDPDEAASLYQQAIALGTNDPAVYIAAGTSLLDRIGEGIQQSGKAQAADVIRTRTFFERATQLDPGSALAWAGLGATFVAGDDDVAPGIKALEKGLELAPGHEATAYNLVQLYARARRGSEAKALYERVLAGSSNAELVKQGREAVLIGEVHRAEELIQAGKMAEAVPILRSVMATTTNERLKAHLAENLRRADASALAETQVTIVESAISMAGAGKFEEALKILDGLLPQITDAEFKENVTRLRADLLKAKEKRR